MEDLCDVLFEFSSIDRMNIMNSLLEERLKLSHVSQKLDMTVTEASRHLQRLSDLQLIEKDVEGKFGPTSYGELAIKLLSGLGFVSKNREYILEHDICSLPDAFISRINELGFGAFDSNVVGVIAHVNKIIENANEYFWVMSDGKTLPDTLSILKEKVRGGISLRRINPEGENPVPNTPVLSDIRRRLPEIPLRIVMNETEAMCGFPTLGGKIDYRSYISKDQRFHKWCCDIFLYYWDKARPETV